MNAITLKWEGIDLHASRDAWFNATEIAEAHGKRLDKFWEREETREHGGFRKALLPQRLPGLHQNPAG